MDDTDLLDSLNRRFAIPGRLAFRRGPGGLVVAEIANGLGEATVALQGAHVTAFRPKGQQPVLWLSERAQFGPGKSIRGGVPICWPWFGPHPTDPDKPAHGFARTLPWTVLATANEDGANTLHLGLTEGQVLTAQWPLPCTVQAHITVADTLRLELVTRNLGREPMVLGEALHSYFRVGDLAQTTIRGLENCPYLDKVENFARKTQDGPLTLDGETDRIYLATEADCLIEDRALARRIRVAKAGSRSTVVWNPGPQKARALGDIPPGGERGMVCVESANAAEDTVTLDPDAEHRMTVRIDVEPLD